MLQIFRKTFLLFGLSMITLARISSADVTPDTTTLTAERPKDEAFRSELKKELSSLNLAIEASANELSDNLNRMTPKELYKGSTKTRGLTADILRNGPITVSAADNFIYLTIPVTLSLSYGIFETPTIATTLKFKLTAKVTPDWKINTEIYYLGLSDQLAENLWTGPISIKPRSIVVGVTQPVQRTITDLANKKLNEQFPLKIQAAKVWNAVQKPIQLNKGYNAWLKITPREALVYPLQTQNNRVKLSMGITSLAELVVGPEPPDRAVVPLPVLKQVTVPDRLFRLALNTDLFFKDILKIASPLLLNKELGNDGKSIILKGLDLYGNGDHLMIKLVTTGDLDGIFYLTCRPVFNPQTSMFSVEDVDFDMQAQSLLLQSADWFLHGSIRSSIQEKLNMDLTQRLAQAREVVGKAMSRVSLADNVFLTGSVKTMRLNDVLVQKDRISIQVYVEGETAIVFH